MSVIVIKNRFGLWDDTELRKEVAQCVPNVQKLYEASIVLFSTETKYFTFITGLAEPNIEVTEVKATKSIENVKF